MSSLFDLLLRKAGASARTCSRVNITPSTRHIQTFFNRTKEVASLNTLLNSTPAFTIMLGPPSSGKTALARHVVNQKIDDKTPMYHPLVLNLRNVNMTAPGAFEAALIGKALGDGTDPIWKTWLAALELEVNGLVKVKTGTAPTSSFPPAPKVPSFDEALAGLSSQVPAWTSWVHGSRPPILVVDEANELRYLNHEILERFLKFIVMVTKEEQRMHVVFTSSDSFFEHWLVNSQLIPPTHFDTLVLGDLPKEEAYEYFVHLLDQVASNEVENLLKADRNSFDSVFELTGGRMLFLQKYITETLMMRAPPNVSNFGPILQACGIMEADILRSNNYTKKDVKHVFKRVVESSNGAVSFIEMEKELGGKNHGGYQKLHHMISRNLILYRPASSFARDIEMTPQAVITPTGVPGLRAMQMILSKDI